MGNPCAEMDAYILIFKADSMRGSCHAFDCTFAEITFFGKCCLLSKNSESYISQRNYYQRTCSNTFVGTLLIKSASINNNVIWISHSWDLRSNRNNVSTIRRNSQSYIMGIPRHRHSTTRPSQVQTTKCWCFHESRGTISKRGWLHGLYTGPQTL